MKAIVLAAGKGERLRPYTDSVPKCMVPINGKPMLSHQLSVLRKFGLDDVTVVCGYLHDQIDLDGIEKIINHEFDRTNMVYTLFCAEQLMKEGEDVLIAYGDIVYDPKVLEPLLAAKVDQPYDIEVAVDRGWRKLWELRLENPLEDAETLKVDDGRIVEIGKKPNSYDDIQGQYIGLVKVNGRYIGAFKNLWRDLKESKDPKATQDYRNMYFTDFLQLAIDKGAKVGPVWFENGWVEVDTVEDLTRYEDLIASNGSSREILPRVVCGDGV